MLQSLQLPVKVVLKCVQLKSVALGGLFVRKIAVGMPQACARPSCVGKAAIF